MEARRMEHDTATVDCLNSDQCGGRITLRGRLYEVTATERSDATLANFDLIEQTCDCEYSEDDKEVIMDRVSMKLDHR
jgi:hypothetical protein